MKDPIVDKEPVSELERLLRGQLKFEFSGFLKLSDLNYEQQEERLNLATKACLVPLQAHTNKILDELEKQAVNAAWNEERESNEGFTHEKLVQEKVVPLSSIKAMREKSL